MRVRLYESALDDESRGSRFGKHLVDIPYPLFRVLFRFNPFR